ncbi:hypothetical protein [Streptomyces ziwulingensis]|uniref:Uncharacterized protein n=1 Tax=Streptomyces ziwulingensis TaxID=1045501 RepID=A0ABP9D098_9ACTN
MPCNEDFEQWITDNAKAASAMPADDPRHDLAHAEINEMLNQLTGEK